MNSTELFVGWASYAAAKYACENFHYSKCLPAGKIVKIGVWENKKFIGVVLFSRGANRNLSGQFNLRTEEAIELTRVALFKHVTPVSRIIKIAIKLLKQRAPKIRLIVSYADTNEGHNGGIYQAGNWIYTGLTPKDVLYWVNNKWSHKRSLWKRIDHSTLKKKTTLGKHRYIMPLNKKDRVRFEHLSQPYPLRQKLGDDCDQQNSDGATPILTLQNTNL